MHLLRTAAQEASYVAGRLRTAHLLDGMPWSRMAVVVRGGSRTATLRRVSTQTGTPVKELFTLFPGKPAKKMAYVSGLPKPKGCV